MKLKTEWAVLATAGAAQFLVLLESTIVNVALPSVGRDLDGPEGLLSWVLSAYLLAFGALLLPGGVWADRRGGRPVFLAGLVGFGVASALCAVSPGLALLVVGRVIQGAAAGVLAASALGVILATYTGARERAVAMTVWSALGVVGSVVGSLVAGPLIAWLGWPGVFWINVVAVVALTGPAWRVIVVRTVGALAASAPPSVLPALAGAVGAAGVLAGLSIAETSASTGVLVALSGAAILVGVVLAQLRSVAPILPVRLFGHRGYRIAATGLFASNGLMIATMYAYSVHLQDGIGLSATVTSYAVLPMALAALVVAFAADLIIGRLGEKLTFRIAGLSLVAGALVLLAVAVDDAAWGWVILGGVLVGAGLPGGFVVLNRMAFSDAEVDEAGTAAGFTNMVTIVGGAVTVALTSVGSAVGGQSGAYGVLVVFAVIVGALSLVRVS